MIGRRNIAMPLVLLLLVIACSCSNESDTEPLAGAGLFEGELQVYGAPCNGDALRSIAVVIADDSDGQPETLWKVSDPSPDEDAYTFLVRDEPPTDYQLDVGLDGPLPTDQPLAVVVETTESSASMDFVLSELSEDVVQTNHGQQPSGFAFLTALSESIYAGEGCAP